MSIKVMAALDGKGDYLISTNSIKAGETFFEITEYQVFYTSSRTSIQKTKYEHIEEFSHLAYLNHSCNPNIIIDFSKMALIGLRDIEPNEELNFFYPSTEWVLSTPFECLCGSSRCIGKVTGAKHLSLNVLGHYFLNQHIQDELA